MQPERKTYTVQEAIGKLEHYCAYQERCHKEVVQKLTQMHMIPEAIDVIVLHLLEHNFLNESRFAKQFASGKFKIKHWGKNRISFELKKKDISKIVSKTDNKYNPVHLNEEELSEALRQAI